MSGDTVRRWAGRLLPGLILLAGMTSVVSAQDPLHTRNARFRIPFQFDEREMTRLGAIEVQLHVSTDAGRSWQLFESVTPSAEKFTFEAPSNGEYWFAVLTVDVQGRRFPNGPLQPGLKVIVDDLPPVLNLRLVAREGGQVELNWEAVDDHLRLQSLRMEYLDEATGAWQPLSVPATPSGNIRFDPGSGEEVLVRGHVSDEAGNATTANTSLRLERAPALRRAPEEPSETPDFRRPIAGPRQREPESLTAAEPKMQTATEPAAPQSGDFPLIIPNAPHAPVPQQYVAGSGPREWSQLTRPTSVSRPLALPLEEPAQQPEAPAAPIQQFKQDHALPEPVATAAPPTSRRPHRRVNSLSFRIGYEVEGVGPSGVGGVDLYITENDGRKWFHYGEDPDRRSPFDVAVPREGTYGFAIRVRNGVGLSETPPQPGDRPEMQVTVDRTPPKAQLLSLDQFAEGLGTTVRVQWSIDDQQLASRPVALSQSTTPNGPWEQVLGWSENTGGHEWQIISLGYESLYIKLDVRDEAGNVASVISTRPLTIDTSRPTARLLQVE